MRPLALLSVAVLSFVACGDDGVAATATKGDEFCTLAEDAKQDNDALDSIDVTDAAKVELEFGAAIDSLTAAAARAPKDITETLNELLTNEQKLEQLLKASDYDVIKMSETDEGKKLIDDASVSPAGDEFKAYLADKCGIETAATTP